ncbi:MAG: restriction endonuclease subunit S [Anaerolineaceae bacterium]|nr:restriction endonuclease subunit S [Anaerolineaceae bacterium]
MKRNEWSTKSIGDMSDLVTKGTTPTSVGHEFVKEGINFVKVETLSITGQFIKEKFDHINSKCHSALKRSQLEEGDILFSIAGALGRTALVTDNILPANTNQALAIIRLKQDENVSRKFVLKALETGIVLDQIEKSKGGVAQQNLSLAQVRELQIPLPPLPEQQRIVAILDQAFAAIATAKANAQKNLQNARELFESHLQTVFTQRGEGWVERKLGDICEVLDSRRIPITQRDRIAGVYPYYGASGILDYVNDYIFDEKLVLIGEDGAKWGAREKSAFIAEGK